MDSHKVKEQVNKCKQCTLRQCREQLLDKMPSHPRSRADALFQEGVFCSASHMVPSAGTELWHPGGHVTSAAGHVSGQTCAPRRLYDGQ